MRIVGPIKFWRVCVIYLEKKRVVDASTRPLIHASARPHDGSTRGRWMLCTHPPFLGLHMCNKMGSTPVLPRKIRQKSEEEKTFFYAAILDHFPKKNVQFWDHFFPELFPKDSESLKILDIRLWEVGANIYISAYMRKGTNRQTDRQTHILTSRLLDRIGPVGRFDENYKLPNTPKKYTNKIK